MLSRVVLAVLITLLGLSLQIYARHRLMRNGKHGALGLPKINPWQRRFLSRLTTPQWFNQKLDHFNPQNTDTWKQRFFVRSDKWNETGPVFLQLGGEGEANPIWLVKGHVAEELSDRFNAYNIYIEHRYYGKSHPTKNMSTENLQYLTSEQALADFSNFIQQYTILHPELAKVPWIVFGGSYSGSLAAWLKLKYPHLVSGSIASSAPLLAEIDFVEYQEVVTKSIGPKCSNKIQKAISQVQRLLEHPMGWRTLTKDFALCTNLDAKIQTNLNNFLANLVDIVDGVVQYNKDNRDFEGAKPITIDDMCNVMTNESDNQLEMKRFATVNQMVLNSTNQTCLGYDYAKMINDMRKVDWNSTAAEGGRQWTYQTCAEFGFFQTTDSENELFQGLVSLDFYQQQCIDIFGPKFTSQYLNQAVANTNTFYGARRLRADRVLLPNGSIDPWHALGVTNFSYASSRSLYIQGTAHCADMYPTSKDDLDSLKDARQQISDYIEFLVSTSD